MEWGLDESLKDWAVLWDYGALLALTDCVYRFMKSYDFLCCLLPIFADCVYRSMEVHGFAYIVDLDEFIVPQVTGFGLMLLVMIFL